MPLPECQCVNGLPTQQQLGFIYCALLEILAGSGGGLTLPLSPPNGGTGVANAVGETITINGGFPLALTLTGPTGVTLPTTGTIQVFNQSLNTGDAVTFGNLNVAAGNTQLGNLTFSTVGGGADSPAPDGTYTPVTSITISNGVIIAIS